ncbi:MAG: hypothetical protein Q6L60_13300 [Thermostichus sp. HHBFW_bins_43]
MASSLTLPRNSDDRDQDFLMGFIGFLMGLVAAPPSGRRSAATSLGSACQLSITLEGDP